MRDTDPGSGQHPDTPEHQDSSAESRSRLQLPVRIGLLAVGWLIVILGLAGLLLPGLQGVLLIVLGCALLSVASETVHVWLQRWLAGHPRIRSILDRFRRKVHSKLGRSD